MLSMNCENGTCNTVVLYLTCSYIRTRKDSFPSNMSQEKKFCLPLLCTSLINVFCHDSGNIHGLEGCLLLHCLEQEFLLLRQPNTCYFHMVSECT